MSLLRNATPYLAQALPFVDDDGAEGQLLVIKLQYRIGTQGELALLPETEPLVFEDRYDENFAAVGPLAGLAPLLRPADVMAPQPSTNVLLQGHAHPPTAGGGRPFEPWIGVGASVFPMRVHGPRRWRKRWLLTRLLTLFIPRRFKPRREGEAGRVALRWQHAYGGVDAFRGRAEAQVWPYNPAGQGFHAEPKAASVAGLALPLIEHPQESIRRWQDRRAPQLPGAINARWSPRAAAGGTRDARWQATRAPAMPDDGTAMFHNTAHPALQFTPHLQGGVALRAVGFLPGNAGLGFELPQHGFELHAYHYGEFHAAPVPLNTVLIDAEARRLTLLYRAFVPDLLHGNGLRRLALGATLHAPELRP